MMMMMFLCEDSRSVGQSVVCPSNERMCVSSRTEPEQNQNSREVRTVYACVTHIECLCVCRVLRCRRSCSVVDDVRWHCITQTHCLSLCASVVIDFHTHAHTCLLGNICFALIHTLTCCCCWPLMCSLRNNPTQTAADTVSVCRQFCSDNSCCRQKVCHVFREKNVSMNEPQQQTALRELRTND